MVLSVCRLKYTLCYVICSMGQTSLLCGSGFMMRWRTHALNYTWKWSQVLNGCTWFTSPDTSGIQKTVQKRRWRDWDQVRRFTDLKHFQVHEMTKWPGGKDPPVYETISGSQNQCNLVTSPMTDVTTADSLPSFPTPCDMILFSDFSFWPIMSLRLQQHLTFQCIRD